MIRSPSVFFCVAVLAIDIVLLSREHEQHDHEHDQRALRGHVEAEREIKDWDGDLVERPHEHVDDEAEEEPDPEMREHQVGGFSPVGDFSCFVIGGLRHGLHFLPQTRLRERRFRSFEGNANPFSAAPPLPRLQPVLCRFKSKSG